MEKLLTKKQVAELYQLKERTIDRYVEEGKLRALTPAGGSGAVRFDPEDVRNFFRSNSSDRLSNNKPAPEKQP